MAKNTKAIKTEKVVKHWFESRNHGKSEITAMRIPTANFDVEDFKEIVSKDRPELPVEVIPNKPVKTIKEGSNMWYARIVLTEANGKISIDDAVEKLLAIHKLRTDNIMQAKKIFIHANSWGLPVKITVENKVKYVELA